MSRLERQSAISDLQFAIEKQANRKSKIANRKFLTYFARRGWAHLILLTGAAIFLFPFLWMIVTSVKTDDELMEGGWWPTIPRFRDSSPYIRPAVEVHRPAYVSEEQWDSMLPALRDRAISATAGNESAATVILERTIPRLPRDLWPAPSQLLDSFTNLLTPDAISAAIDDRTASLDLLGLQIRTLDAQIHNIPANWIVQSPRASIHTRGDTRYLRYDFTNSREPITLTANFDFPSDPEQLHKLIVSIRPDDSWHRLDATLEVNGDQWQSTRPFHLAQHRPTSVIFQPPTFDDITLQARTWIPLRVAKSEIRNTKSETNPKSKIQNPKSILTLTLTPSSTAHAAWAKISRNYFRAFHAVPFWRYVANSILLVALTTIGALFSSTFVAYAFARLHWPGRGAALVLLLSTMMIPPQVTMIPSFMIWRSAGWYNTLNPLWVPAFFGGAFFIFLMTQHMKTIPRELEEAARLDGLNAVATWYYIILPQVKPAAAAVAIMTFMWSWNEFLGPLIYLRDQTRFPLSLGLFALRLEYFGDWSLIMAANVLMTLPVIVLFFLCQRYFIEGVTMTGMKS